MDLAKSLGGLLGRTKGAACAALVGAAAIGLGATSALAQEGVTLPTVGINIGDYADAVGTEVTTGMGTVIGWSFAIFAILLTCGFLYFFFKKK